MFRSIGHEALASNLQMASRRKQSSHLQAIIHLLLLSPPQMSTNPNPDNQAIVVTGTARDPDCPNKSIVVELISKYSGSSAGGVGRRGSRQERLRGRRAQARGPLRIEQIIVRGGNATLSEIYAQDIVTGLRNAGVVSSSRNLDDLLNIADQSLESNELISELDTIFSDLHEIDSSITVMQDQIDELREGTRAILAEITQLTA